uniref:eEF-1B gamma n=1 Tax=Syphacia muris TaxID=451379 RepID=A0A0N5AK07_9BILA
MKLYGSGKSFRTQKVLIAAKLANVDVTLCEGKPPHNKFPLEVTPAYEDGEVKLFGAESIALHLAKNVLATDKCTEVLQWMQWAEGSLLPNVLGYVLPSVSAAKVDNKVIEYAKHELLSQLKCFNGLLLSRTFLVGERLSLADISVAMDLLPAYQYVLDDSARADLVNLNRWFKTIINQPAVKSVIGEVTFASKAVKFDQSKFDALSASLKKSAPEAKADKGEKKRDGKKHDDLDETERALASEPKSSDPFASVPKGKFVMDAFKRVYSNEDTATKAIPYFWENFDPEHYSIWFAEYKYSEELTLTFMSCNLIGGMFQRLEKLKKHAFASVCLFGSDNNSTISGIWVWPGQELAFPLCQDWQIDYESYDWKKLDVNDPATKKLVNEYLLWEGDFSGKTFNQGKIFK